MARGNGRVPDGESVVVLIEQDGVPHSVDVYTPCPDCGGWREVECPDCPDQGEDSDVWSSFMPVVDECDTCGGEESIVCERCDGEGFVPRDSVEQSVDVDPADGEEGILVDEDD